MMARICFGLFGCLMIVSLLAAAGPYDVPGNVDVKDVRNAPWVRSQVWDELSVNLLRGWSGIWHPD